MDWLKELRKEQEELAGRLDKLKAFSETDGCKDKFLLRQQLRFMTGYEIILRQRLNRAKEV